MADETHEEPPPEDEAFNKAVIPLLALVESLAARFEVEVVDLSFDQTRGTGEVRLRLRLPLAPSSEQDRPS